MPKKLISTFTLIGFLFIFSSVYSQNPDIKNEPKYLIDLNKTKLTGFGNTHSEVSNVGGQLAYSSGAAGAFLFNYTFYAGIYSLSLQSNHIVENIYPRSHHPISNPLPPSFTNNKICFNHGGIMIGNIFNPNRLWHVNTNLKIGTGRISLTDKDIDFSAMAMYNSDWVGVLTPELDLELNIARWFKVGFSLGYRFVFAVDETTYRSEQGTDKRLFSSNQFSTPTAAIKFHFGNFGPTINGNNGNN
jgi:hypothetical protein